VTPRGHEVLAGAGVALALPARKERGRARKPPSPEGPPPDADLVERLRRFRREAASRDSMPPYCVFGDRTLEAIARARPGDLAALGGVQGIGREKLEKCGAAILEITRS